MTTAAVTWSAGQPFAFETVHLDGLRDDEVRVRTVAVGICHTDISAADGVIPFPLPGVLGHEGVGIVEEVGAAVRRAAVGDRVLMTFSSCGRCRWCRDGHSAYCERHNELNLFGGRRLDGSTTMRCRGVELNAHFFGQSSFADEAVVDERSLVVLPRELAEGDLPPYAALGCGIQTGAGAILNVMRPRPGSVVAVCGAGAVGLAAVMATKFAFPSRVIAVDRVAARLQLAAELGATDVVDTSQSDLTREISRITAGRGLDFVVESTGNVPLLELMVANLAARGRCAVIGAPPGGSRASFDVNSMIPGRTIQGVTLGDSEPETFVPALIEKYQRGEFPMDRMQRTYPFRNINQAVADARTGESIKPILVF